MATEKAFAAETVSKIETVLSEVKYTLVKPENDKSKDELLAADENVDVMFIRSDIGDSAVVEKAAKLKIVVCAGAGYDNIDLKVCGEKSVMAMNTPGQNEKAAAGASHEAHVEKITKSAAEQTTAVKAEYCVQ